LNHGYAHPAPVLSSREDGGGGIENYKLKIEN